jgi:hypothetical protein
MIKYIWKLNCLDSKLSSELKCIHDMYSILLIVERYFHGKEKYEMTMAPNE